MTRFSGKLSVAILSLLLVALLGGCNDSGDSGGSDCSYAGKYAYTLANKAGGFMTLDQFGQMSTITINTCPGATLVSSTTTSNSSGLSIVYTINCKGKNYTYRLVIGTEDCTITTGTQSWNFGKPGDQTVTFIKQ